MMIIAFNRSSGHVVLSLNKFPFSSPPRPRCCENPAFGSFTYFFIVSDIRRESRSIGRHQIVCHVFLALALQICVCTHLSPLSESNLQNPTRILERINLARLWILCADAVPLLLSGSRPFGVKAIYIPRPSSGY
jgi:hypothetical protein